MPHRNVARGLSSQLRHGGLRVEGVRCTVARPLTDRVMAPRHQTVIGPVRSVEPSSRYSRALAVAPAVSYHVATIDFDRDVINVEAAAFAKQVT